MPEGTNVGVLARKNREGGIWGEAGYALLSACVDDTGDRKYGITIDGIDRLRHRLTQTHVINDTDRILMAVPEPKECQRVAQLRGLLQCTVIRVTADLGHLPQTAAKRV